MRLAPLFVLSMLLLSSPLWAKKFAKFEVQLSPVGSFEAKTAVISGVAKKSKGGKIVAKNVAIPLRTFKSGIDLRDKHMHEKYFEVKKYPQAVLSSAVGKGGNFVGKLKIHGSKPQTVKGKYKVKGSYVLASFKVKMSQFKIKKAKYMGVGVEDDVTVQISIPLK